MKLMKQMKQMKQKKFNKFSFVEGESWESESMCLNGEVTLPQFETCLKRAKSIEISTEVLLLGCLGIATFASVAKFALSWNRSKIR